MVQNKTSFLDHLLQISLHFLSLLFAFLLEFILELMKQARFLLPAGACWLLLWFSLAQGQREPKQRVLELLDKGRQEEAREVLLEMVGRQPADQQAQALLGQIAFGRKEYQEAVARFAKAPSILQANPLLLVSFAEALLESNEGDSATRLLQKVPEEDAIAQFESGLLLARHGEYAASERHLMLARGAYPDKSVAAYNLAFVQYLLGEFAECAGTLQDVPQQFKTGDVLNLLGLAFIEMEEFQKAAQILQEAARRHPLDERNYVAIARLSVEGAMPPSMALEFLDRGVTHLPASQVLHIQRGYLRLSQGRYGEAVSDYRKAIELQPDSETARLGLAFVLVEDQRHEEAIALLEDTIRRYPSSAYAHYLLGEMTMTQGVQSGTTEEAESLRLLKRATALEPDFVLAHTSLGKLYLKRNDLGSAIRELETSIRLDPEATPAYYQLSIAYRKAGEREKALGALQQVRRLNREERKLGADRFLYRKLKRGAAQLYAPR